MSSNILPIAASVRTALLGVFDDVYVLITDYSRRVEISVCVRHRGVEYRQARSYSKQALAELFPDLLTELQRGEACLFVRAVTASIAHAALATGT